jgi:hypothetical protein
MHARSYSRPVTNTGGQVRSLLSLVSYLGTDEFRERYLGVRIPPANLQDYHLDQASVRGTTGGLTGAGGSVGVLVCRRQVAEHTRTGSVCTSVGRALMRC